jgi:hypothetical protein
MGRIFSAFGIAALRCQITSHVDAPAVLSNDEGQ